MEELTAEEVIKYAVRIEQESYQFYKKAAKMLEGSDLARLAEELADQEVGHINHLRELIKEDEADESALSRLLIVDTSLFEKIVEMREVPLQATPADVLKLALEREEKTKNNYEMLAGLENLSGQIRKTFNYLKEMEERHAERISERIRKLKAP